MYSFNPESGESIGGFETLAERFAHVADAVSWINEVYPVELTPTPETPSSVTNVVGLSRMVETEPNHDDYISGLGNAA